MSICAINESGYRASGASICANSSCLNLSTESGSPESCAGMPGGITSMAVIISTSPRMNIRAVLMVSPFMRFWKIPEFRQETTEVFPEGRYKELRSLHLLFH